ncbi:hypothetical protein HPP92_022789 [Vanilla planifolia]|nr:hypothetical protein HPP92_022789 [Vanilla planifolia]
MTFFYNGAVTVFNVARDTADRIIKMADEQYVEHRLLRNLHDVPLARKKSLQRFLEKRRERLTATTPYTKSVK